MKEINTMGAAPVLAELTVMNLLQLHTFTLTDWYAAQQQGDILKVTNDPSPKYRRQTFSGYSTCKNLAETSPNPACTGPASKVVFFVPVVYRCGSTDNRQTIILRWLMEQKIQRAEWIICHVSESRAAQWGSAMKKNIFLYHSCYILLWWNYRYDALLLLWFLFEG